MKLLSIDTSTKNFSLAVSDQDKILHYRNVKLNKVLSSSIIPSIRRILDQSGLSLKQIDGFAVGLGPGSFTSLRVGLSTVKGLALQKPVVGIPSLDILAMNVMQEKGSPVSQICTLSDAKRRLVYACLYQRQGNQIKRICPYLLTDIDDVLGKIKKETLFIGDGVGLYREVLSENRLVMLASERNWFPQAKQLAALAFKRFSKGKQSGDNIDKLVPLYLYPKECQIRKR